MKIPTWANLVLAGLLVISAGFNFGFARALRTRPAPGEPGGETAGNNRETGWRRESLRQRLDLAPEQAEKLEQGRTEMRRLMVPLGREIRENRRALVEESRRREVDEAEIERLVQESARLHAEIERLVIRQIIEARKNLDEEQWDKIDNYLRRESSPRRPRPAPGETPREGSTRGAQASRMESTARDSGPPLPQEESPAGSPKRGSGPALD